MKRNTTLALSSTAALAAFANAGAAAKTAAPVAVAAKRTDPVIVGSGIAIKLPENVAKSSNRGSKSPYPFDTLELGTAFGVKDKTAKQLSSIVSNQNRKKENFRNVVDAEGKQVFETREVRDQAGNLVGTVPDETKPKREQVKKFEVYDVTPEIAATLKGTALEGSSVIVLRTK